MVVVVNPASGAGGDAGLYARYSTHAKPDAVINAVIYARYSSHAQNEQSIEAQLAEGHKYAQARGYNVIHEYVDRAKTGKTDNRQAFQQMLRDTSKKAFQVIILWKIDRFGRNREEIAMNKIRCKKNGVRVEYVAESIPDSPEGVLLESLLEGLAEYYSLQLAQNVKRGMYASAMKCQCVGGNRPLGYTTDENKRFMIDPQTGPVVKQIFESYAAGHTVTEIIQDLNEKGFRTLRGKPFNKNSLHRLLKNEKYLGVYIYGDIRVVDGMPRLIEPELFEKVQEMLKVNKRIPAHSWHKTDFLLTDKLFCGECGAKMVGKTGTGRHGGRYSYYSCVNRVDNHACEKKNIPQKELEELVLQEAQKIIFDDKLLEVIADKTYDYCRAQGEQNERLTSLQTQLKSVESALENLVRAVESGAVSAALMDRLNALEDQKKDIETAISKENLVMSKAYRLTRDQILFFLVQFRDLDYSDRKSQKRLIATFVNSIFAYDGRVVINFNYTGSAERPSHIEVKIAWESAGEGVRLLSPALHLFFGTISLDIVLFDTFQHYILW